MTLDEAIKHAEEFADTCEYAVIKYDMTDAYESHVACQVGKCAEEQRQLAEWLKELKQLREQTRWIPVSEYGYPKFEDEYKHFLTSDNRGEITIQEFLLSIDKEPQPYFTGMRNIIAYMPLPKAYKPD